MQLGLELARSPDGVTENQIAEQGQCDPESKSATRKPEDDFVTRLRNQERRR